MEMHPVKSSMASSVGYDPDSKMLYVQYTSGVRYRHANVPPAKFDALMASPSKGVYLNTHIKPHHPAVKA